MIIKYKLNATQTFKPKHWVEGYLIQFVHVSMIIKFWNKGKTNIYIYRSTTTNANEDSKLGRQLFKSSQELFLWLNSVIFC